MPVEPYQTATRIVRFGPYRADFASGELYKGASRIRLQNFPFKILDVLANRAMERGDEPVTRDELRTLLWDQPAGDFDVALNTAIRKIRTALVDSADLPRYIETLPKRGYRFVCPVEAEVQKPNQAPEVQTVEPPTVQRRKWLPVLLVSAAVVAIGIFVDRLMVSRQPVPHVLNSVQITNDGQPKFAPIVSDGRRLYFNERTASGWNVVQVPIAGGAPSTVVAGTGLYLDDLARDGSQMLLQGSPVGIIETDTPMSIMQLPEGPVRQLPISGHSGKWSPDGSQLVWAKGADLLLGGHDGSGVKKILTVAGAIKHILWSPDGKKVRFGLTSLHQEFADIREVSVDGSGYRQVTRGPSIPGAWTPDGRNFLYYDDDLSTVLAPSELRAVRETPSPRAGPFQLTSGALAWAFPFIPRDGKRVFAVGRLWRGELSRYDSGLHQFVPWMNGISADGVVYSPDGKWAAYTLWPERTLWRSRADGSARLQLTFAPVKVHYPRWSPDGKSLAFTSRPNRGETGKWRIHTVSSEGGPLTTLPSKNIDEAIPAWAPDGKRIVFGGAPWMENWAADSTSLWVFDRQTEKITPLAGGHGLWAPKWSPDGRYIAAETVGSRQFMVLDRGVSPAKWSALPALKGVIGYSAWSHDSQYLYFNLTDDPVIYRIRVADRREEEVLRVTHFRVPDSLGPWFALAPDDSPLMLRDTSMEEIYRFDAVFP